MGLTGLNRIDRCNGMDGMDVWMDRWMDVMDRMDGME